MSSEPGALLRCRCRLGHAFAAASIGEAGRRTAESSLLAAIRLLEQRAAEVTCHAHLLREMLTSLPA